MFAHIESNSGVTDNSEGQGFMSDLHLIIMDPTNSLGVLHHAWEGHN